MTQILDVSRGNARRKALLKQMLERAGINTSGGGAVGLGREGANASTPFGGMRAGRAQSGGMPSLAHPSQVAAQFVGGLGVGGAARAGTPGAQEGNPISRFLPTGGGPVERRLPGPPEAPQAPQQDVTPADEAPTDLQAPESPAASAPDPLSPAQSLQLANAPAPTYSTPFDYSAASNAGTVDTNALAAASGGPVGAPIVDAGFYTQPSALSPNQALQLANAPAPAPAPAPEQPRQMASAPAATPTSGASSLIPLGGGAYFDPSNGTIRYPNNTMAM